MRMKQLGVSLVTALVCVGVMGSTQGIDVVRGKPVDFKGFEWQVALVRSGERPEVGTYCGGTLLNGEWVLTAAHCVHHRDSCKIMTKNELRVGYGAVRLEKLKLAKVETILVPDGYQCKQFKSDIALIKLTAVLKGVRSISLPSVNDNVSFAAGGQSLNVAGWGYTSENGMSSQDLLEAEVKVIDYVTCNGKQQYNGKVPADAICAGLPGVDACTGDSGGPLFKRLNANDPASTAVQIGVVSHGEGCAQKDRPGIYSTITPHLAWLRTSTGIGVCTPEAIKAKQCYRKS